MFDFTNVPPPQERGAPIPDGTICVVRMAIKPGGVGPGNWFTRASSGSEMLCAEYTVIEGEHARRKFFDNLIINGATAGAESMAVETLKILGAIINSGFNLNPADDSPAARARRTNVGPEIFNGLCFLAKVGVETGKLKNDGSGEKWPDKNRLVIPITPDRPEWRGPIPQTPPTCATPAQNAIAVVVATHRKAGVGEVMKSHITFTLSPSAIEQEWQRQITSAAILGARRMTNETIPPATPIGRLSDTEWGFLVAAIIFEFVAMRAQQASSEGSDIEHALRMTCLDPDPWDAGPILAILPELAETCGDLDWSQPIGKWPKEMMAKFLIAAMKLIQPAIEARDRSARGITQRATEKELNDDISF